ncbi:MAG: enoyl-CoA hydratase/isomerase family protein [Betaproteobacteria bacterium]|nr:MAG: enoyl-CoA hydratase/isomerase family protein [Betaproteobacteria bacterium]
MSASTKNTAPGVLVDTERHPQGTVYRLTVNRPERLNILNGAVMDEINSALGRIANDDDARVVILDGAGDKAWIGGADINEMVALNSQSARTFITRLHSVCRGLRELPVPVVASIDGYCLGAGLEIAACCDLRIATPASRFGMPEVRVGIPSVIEAAMLPRLIGTGRARDLVMTARIIGANEASVWGLTECIGPGQDLVTVVNERVEMVLESGPNAMRSQKALCRGWEELSLNESIQAGIDAFVEAYTSDEPQVYMNRFLHRPRG